MQSKKLLFVAIIFFANTSYGQISPLISAYKAFDITKSSGELLSIINAQMQKVGGSDYKKLVAEKQATFYKKFDFGDSTQRQAYISQFNMILDNTRNNILKNEVMFHIDKNKIAESGSPILSRYLGNNSSENINKFLYPAIQAGIAEYSTSQIQESVNTVLKQINSDSLLLYFNAVLQSKQIALTANTSVEDIKNYITRITDIINFDTSLANYSKLSIKTIAEDFKQKIDNGWHYTISNQNGNLEQIQSSLKTNFASLIKNVKIDAENKFQQLGNHIEELTKNEEIVSNTITQIYNEWQVDAIKIKRYEDIIKSHASQNTDQYIQAQQEHALLVAKNFLRLDLINNYVNKGVEVIKTVELIKNGVYDHLFSEGGDLDKFKKLANNFSLPTLREAFSGVGDAANQLSGIFPNNKAIKEVAKFADKITSAINVGVGIGELFSGNPMGLMSIFNGIGGLFGGGGPPTPSPEMQMMQHMMDYLEDNFKNINNRLDSIETKINNLTVLVQDMYVDMMKSFQIISGQLNHVIFNTEVIYSMSHDLVFGNYNTCQIVNDIYNDTHGFNDYNDLLALHNVDGKALSSCLEGINNLANNKINERYFSIEYLGDNLSEISYLKNDVYRPTLNLFKAYWNNNQRALKALSITPKNINSTNEMLYAINDSAFQLDFDSTFHTYYNYALLSEYTELLLRYYPYFYTTKGAQYDPLTFKDFINQFKSTLDLKNKEQIRRLKSILAIVNKAIIQQSLLAGNLMINKTYSTLFRQSNTSNNIDNCILVLNNNRIFAKNFASYLIYNQLGYFGDTGKVALARFSNYASLFDSAKTDDSKLKALNNWLFSNTTDMTFVLDPTYNNIFLELHVSGKQPFTIPVPEPSFVVSNEMSQSDGLYALLKTKQKLINQLIDLTFTSNIGSNDEISADDYKYLSQPIEPIK